MSQFSQNHTHIVTIHGCVMFTIETTRCVKKGYYPEDDEIMLQLKMSERMFQPRYELAWKIHKRKPNQDWEKARDRKRDKKYEERLKLNMLEEVERKKLEKAELQKKLESTKDSQEILAIIERLGYL